MIDWANNTLDRTAMSAGSGAVAESCSMAALTAVGQLGIGYEGDIMTAEAFSGLSAAKFIPIHQKGSWSEAAPSWLLGVLAVNLCTDGFDGPNYRRLLGAIFRTWATRPPIGTKPPWVGDARPKGRYRLVAFDLDGTLLRGMDFSWRLIWAHLGFPDALRKEGMRRYLGGTISYPEWCRLVCDPLSKPRANQGCVQGDCAMRHGDEESHACASQPTKGRTRHGDRFWRSGYVALRSDSGR